MHDDRTTHHPAPNDRRVELMAFIGFHASHEQVPPSTLLQAVIAAERAGFDGAMCSDHFAPWGLDQGESGHAWSWLGAALASTSFSIGTVTAPGQRYHPAITAQAIATLEAMYPDRFWAALGSGEAVNEVVTGDGWPDKSTRDARLEASVEVIRAMLDGEEVSRDDVVRVHRGRLWTRPETPPPLFGAAVTPTTAGRVAAWADGLITVAQPAMQLERVVDAYRDHGGTGPLALQVHVALAESTSAALAIARDQWRHPAITESLWDVEQPEHFDTLAGDPTDEQLLAGALLSDDPVELATRIADRAAVGFDRVYLHEIGRDQATFIERSQHELLPALRDALAPLTVRTSR